MGYLPDFQQSPNLEAREWRGANEGLRLACSLLFPVNIEARSFLEFGYWTLNS